MNTAKRFVKGANVARRAPAVIPGVVVPPEPGPGQALIETQQAASLSVTEKLQYLVEVLEEKITNLTPQTVKYTFKLAEALLAWARQEKELSDRQRVLAKHEHYRVCRALADFAGKIQPSEFLGHREGFAPGPVAWLKNTLKIKSPLATKMRRLSLWSKETEQEFLKSGQTWNSFLTVKGWAGSTAAQTTIGSAYSSLSRVAPHAAAAGVKVGSRTGAAKSARNLAGWCIAYANELDLLQKKDGRK